MTSLWVSSTERMGSGFLSELRERLVRFGLELQCQSALISSEHAVPTQNEPAFPKLLKNRSHPLCARNPQRSHRQTSPPLHPLGFPTSPLLNPKVEPICR